jgi:hypothetical protein
MKQRPPPAQTDAHLRSKADETFQSHVSTEQEASTGPSGTRLWFVTVLLLIGPIMGLLGYTRLTDSRLQMSSSSVVSSQPSDQSNPTATQVPRSKAEVEDTERVETAGSVSTADDSANERLVRRVYDEVLNQGYQLATPYLFAGRLTYQVCDETPTTINSVEFTQRLLAEQRRFHSLTYTIEDITVTEDQVSVSWSAAGRPIDPLSVEPAADEELTWGGLTLWQIANGRIVAGQTVMPTVCAASNRLFAPIRYDKPVNRLSDRNNFETTLKSK